MIKNIVLDIGGILFDDSKSNVEKLLHKDCDTIYKKTYGGNFKECLIGNMSVKEHLELLKDDEDYQDIKYLLQNLSLATPLMKENYEYIKSLKEKGYHLYLLSNITEDSFQYINKVLDLSHFVDGGVYSYQEHVKKPEHTIYQTVLKRFHLDPKETIFFDDKLKNVVAANESGLPSIEFKSIETLKNFIEKEEKGIILENYKF